MKFSVVNKSTILKRFVLHTLQRNITHLAVIRRKTDIKLGILKGGTWKRAHVLMQFITRKKIIFKRLSYIEFQKKIENGGRGGGEKLKKSRTNFVKLGNNFLNFTLLDAIRTYEKKSINQEQQ